MSSQWSTAAKMSGVAAGRRVLERMVSTTSGVGSSSQWTISSRTRATWKGLAASSWDRSQINLTSRVG